MADHTVPELLGGSGKDLLQPQQEPVQQSDQPVQLEGYENLNDAQKAVIDKNDRAELLQIARRCGLSLHKIPNLEQQMVWLFEELNKSKEQQPQQEQPQQSDRLLVSCLELMIDLCDRLIVKPLTDIKSQQLEYVEKLDQECETEDFNISDVPTEQQGSEFILTEENKAVILAIAKLDPSGRKHWSHLHRIAYNEVESFADGSYPCEKTAYNSAVLLMTSDVLTPEQKQEIKAIARRDLQKNLTKQDIIESLEGLNFATAQSLVYGDWEKVIGDINRKRATRSKVLETLDFIHQNFTHIYSQETYEFIKDIISRRTTEVVSSGNGYIAASVPITLSPKVEHRLKVFGDSLAQNPPRDEVFRIVKGLQGWQFNFRTMYTEYDHKIIRQAINDAAHRLTDKQKEKLHLT